MRIDDRVCVCVCGSQSQVRRLECFRTPLSCGKDPTFPLGAFPSLAISHTWVLFIFSVSYETRDQNRRGTCAWAYSLIEWSNCSLEHNSIDGDSLEGDTVWTLNSSHGTYYIMKYKTNILRRGNSTQITLLLISLSVDSTFIWNSHEVNDRLEISQDHLKLICCC